MIDAMFVYDCPNCGKRLSDQVQQTESIDTEADEVYTLLVCCTCYREVRPHMENGVHLMESVDHDRFMWFAQYDVGGNEEDFDEDEWED
jgi:DNA-directed RNA polymerase subunit RPC12/RpoP